MSGGVVVVGAGLAGQRLVERVREGGYRGELTLIGEEVHRPYDRPPLSKAVLRGESEAVELAESDFYERAGVKLLLGTRVVAVDTQHKAVRLDVGGELPYDRLVLATGLAPRALPGTEQTSGVFVLRTIDDAVALREYARNASSAVVVGAGFIGCEVAASLCGLGVSVRVVEAGPAPMHAAVGSRVGSMISAAMVGRGVEMMTGVGVDRVVEADGRFRGVVLSDGTSVDADVLVVGVGSIPVTGFLDGSGVGLADRAHGGGVACDSLGATTAPDVWAIGDVANWCDENGVPSRSEHWNRAIDQAAIVADVLCGDEPRKATLPYFWSDQFEWKIQALGEPRPHDHVEIVESDGPRFLARYAREGRLVGAVGLGRAGALNRLRAKIADRVPVSELVGGESNATAVGAPHGRS